MRIIKKYDQYLKENKGVKMNEDLENIEDPNMDIEVNHDSEDISDDEMPTDEPIPSEISDEFEGDEEGEEEEEGNQYIGNKMLKELANKLGAEVINNSVVYDGKKINFFSETEMYHVDRKKFKTVDEVVNYLQGSTQEDAPVAGKGPIRSDDPYQSVNKNDDEMVENEIEEPMMVEKRSYRTTRKFESFKKK